MPTLRRLLLIFVLPGLLLPGGLSIRICRCNPVTSFVGLAHGCCCCEKRPSLPQSSPGLAANSRCTGCVVAHTALPPPSTAPRAAATSFDAPALDLAAAAFVPFDVASSAPLLAPPRIDVPPRGAVVRPLLL